MNYNYASKQTSLWGKTLGLVKGFARSIVNKADQDPARERKIFLCAGHNKFDSGAVEDGIKEADLTIELRNLIAPKITGFKVLTDDDNMNLSQTVAWIASLCNPNDIVFDIHINDSDISKSSGCEVLVPDRYTDKEYILARRMSEAVSRTLEIPNRGVKLESDSPRGRLAMMRPDAINILLEAFFLSNKDDVHKYDIKKVELATIIANILSGAI